MRAALVGASLIPWPAMAQGGVADACPAAAGRDSDGARGASKAAEDRSIDVAIIASVSAREVRFNRQPEIHVRLCGGMDSVRVIERRNIPEVVVVGQAYRDVYLALEILGRVDAACLARKLGAAPAADTTQRSAAGERCAAVTIGRTESSPVVRAPARPAPGTEDAPGPGKAPSEPQ